MITARIQPSRYTDHITADGTELTKLPYPFYVNEDGSILRQDIWNGNPLRVVGFQRDLAVQQIDMWWRDALRTPDQVPGMYLVTSDKNGDFAVHNTAVADFEVTVSAEDGQNRSASRPEGN